MEKKEQDGGGVREGRGDDKRVVGLGIEKRDFNYAALLLLY